MSARLTILLSALASLLLSVQPAQAADSRYTLVQCHASHRPAAEATSSSRGPYTTQDRCEGGDWRLQVTNAGFAGAGQVGVWALTAPPGTAITGLRLDANLRRDNHHLAQVTRIDDAGNSAVLANGPDTGQGFQGYSWPNLPPSRVVRLQLHCGQPSGCPASDTAHAYARSIEVTLDDVADPVISSVSGTLVGGGWLRGTHSLTAQASDAGSGLQSLIAYVNGVEVGRAPISCHGLLGGSTVSVFSPCPVAPAGAAVTRSSLATSSTPFTDGTNSMDICAQDFAGRRTACDGRTLLIDNAPPGLAFANGQDADDPELIRASVVEQHSGVAGVEVLYRAVAGGNAWVPLVSHLDGDRITARVDSSAVPPGDYEFLVRATDVAGNPAETSRRADGQTMVLRFPLRPSPRLTAHLEPGGADQQTLRYGRDAGVAGRLVASDGTPVANAEVRVVEYFGSGALIDRRVRVVTTSPDGTWASSLPAGPSRAVTATYAGSRRYGAATSGDVAMNVLGRASFRTSRNAVPEGGRVLFRGRVDHLGARIPPGGKLVELQVRESASRWNTVREAFHTGPNGRYRLGYRFGRFYQSDAEFKFRVKVTREQGWAYKAPVRSKSRLVTVRAR